MAAVQQHQEEGATTIIIPIVIIATISAATWDRPNENITTHVDLRDMITNGRIVRIIFETKRRT